METDCTKFGGWLKFFYIVFIVFMAVLQALLASGQFKEAFDYPHHILGLLLFSLYLTQSKRVPIYYPLPEEEKETIQITRDESTVVAHGMAKMFFDIHVDHRRGYGFRGRADLCGTVTR
jgi:hypothetical protein